ncbi:MAG: hypothetical protein R2873_31125 [Caldilineaceae bacterium]
MTPAIRYGRRWVGVAGRAFNVFGETIDCLTHWKAASGARSTANPSR